MYIYRSLTKEDPLWNVRPFPSLASISFRGLKLIWKSAHRGLALQIRNFHCLDSLRMWWAWFAHATRRKLHCCTVVYTSPRCLAHDVTHYLHYFAHFVVLNMMPAVLAHPPVWALCKVHCPWALFRETTVLHIIAYIQYKYRDFLIGTIYVGFASTCPSDVIWFQIDTLWCCQQKWCMAQESSLDGFMRDALLIQGLIINRSSSIRGVHGFYNTVIIIYISVYHW